MTLLDARPPRLVPGTPNQLSVEDGTATFAITPSETVISSHTRPAPSAGKPKYVAAAVCNQLSTSAIVTLKSSGIDRPAKLDGTDYASYAARRAPSVEPRGIPLHVFLAVYKSFVTAGVF